METSWMAKAHFTSTWRAASTCAAFLLVGAISPAYAHHMDKQFSVQVHPLITLHNPSGHVTISSWDKAEVVVAADHNSDKVEVDAEQFGNRIDIMTHQLAEDIGPDELQANYVITVPEDSELQIHNDSGTVEVSKVLGDMNVETVAAGINAEDIGGYFVVQTVGGMFECMRCTGRLEVRSISGDLKLIDDHSSSIFAQTSTGDILLDGDFLPNGSYRLKNYSGKINVRFSPGDSFDVSATSLHGTVNNEAKLNPPSHPHQRVPRYSRSLFGSINQGRAKLELSSFDGTINIQKRE
ncbi:MAG TPA: DUF4097 family beta strand repeat-containing protein [Candidatus Acidoferrales bacterium]|nr:DUF4097 family beta strand repeat-containing protein [Candidatus Acidoferrales bacterium]